ncbi:hypothetical protein G7078_03835 [Sphingomonas sinipercae]|uniref:Uncharacterized protein n=1 Tax=Sphingomonas sinipercae TaxID=2714944 RepID=A0A6G7ZM58_9SPHN|nr:hypothetical protein [Sphingomonas sinipercae]QIL02000.1 hypothetical protein G7078_03835 [Sphingomonas sinipercae]
MIRSVLVFAAAAALTVPVAAKPLIVPVGESWVFKLKDGDPVHARRISSATGPKKGEIKVVTSKMLGTMMTVTNNSPTSYTFKAELIGAAPGKGAARTCTLPGGAKPALESWPVEAKAVRFSNFKPTRGGHC